jgi:hypothetical protein
MKIFWWQAGLHIEPETKEEHKALNLLLGSAYMTSIASKSRSLKGSCPLGKKGLKVLVASS